MAYKSGLSLQSVKLFGNITQETFLNKGLYLLVSNYNLTCAPGGILSWYEISINIGNINGAVIAQKGLISILGGNNNNLFLGQLTNTFQINADNTSVFSELAYVTNSSAVTFDNTNPAYNQLNYLHFIKIN